MGGIPAWAMVGAKVCLRKGRGERRAEIDYSGVAELPRPGVVYTIRDVVADARPWPCIRLNELRNPPIETTRGILERSFQLSAFRPVVTDSETLGIEAQFYRNAGRKSKAHARESERA